MVRHKKNDTKQIQKKTSLVDIWCTRLQIAFRVFFVSIGTLGLRGFGAGRIHRFSLSPNELFQEKFEGWTTFESNNCYYK